MITNDPERSNEVINCRIGSNLPGGSFLPLVHGKRLLLPVKASGNQEGQAVVLARRILIQVK